MIGPEIEGSRLLGVPVIQADGAGERPAGRFAGRIQAEPSCLTGAARVAARKLGDDAGALEAAASVERQGHERQPRRLTAQRDTVQHLAAA